MAPAMLLDYAGPTQTQSRPLVYRILRTIGLTIVAAIFIAILSVRGALLAAGYVCVFAGTLFLYVGGRRSAGVTLRRWRAYWSEHMHLWWSDIKRPLRRARHPQRALDPLMLPS